MAQGGPSGTGQIPPGVPGADPVGGRPIPGSVVIAPPLGEEPPVVEDETPEPAPLPVPVSQPVDVDGVPPLEVEEEPGATNDDDEVIDPDVFRDEILDEVQRRFDRAISRLNRRQGQSGQPDGGHSGGDGASSPAPPQSPQPAVDTRSIRSYARSVLNDEVEGRQEREAVRVVLDRTIAHTDWSTVDDEEEYVEELVKTLAGTAQTLIKTGSDRKVRQLRSAGMIPQLQQQPGSAAPASHSTSTGMAKGAATAQKRWPGGRRRLNG